MSLNLGRPGQYTRAEKANNWRLLTALLPRSLFSDGEFSQNELICLGVLLKQQTELGQIVALAGEEGARLARLSLRSWWKVIKALEAGKWLIIERKRFDYDQSAINSYRFSRKLLGHFVAESKKLRQPPPTAPLPLKPSPTPKPAPAEAPLTMAAGDQPLWKTEKNLAARVQSNSHKKLLNVFNSFQDRLILPTRAEKSAKAQLHEGRRRSALPPKIAMEFSLRVAEAEDRLLGLRQPLEGDKKPWGWFWELREGGKDPEDLSNHALWIWEGMMMLDPKLAVDMYCGRFGMVDGLAVIMRRYFPRMTIGQFLADLEEIGFKAGQTLLSVAIKIATGNNGEPIKMPVGYYQAALRNPESARPMLSLSYESYKLGGKSGADTNNWKERLAKIWLESLPSPKRKRLFDKHRSGDGSGGTFAKNEHDPIFIARAYWAEFGRWRAIDALEAVAKNQVKRKAKPTQAINGGNGL